MSLKGKRVLITAGPTWVPLDSVRVISNKATGATGRVLAQRLNKKGARVTMLLGPAGPCADVRGIRCIRYNFFDELLSHLKIELTRVPYDIVLHAAAVSDYQVKVPYKGKLGSGRTNVKILLAPTPKIVDLLRKFRPGIFLVGFKFEPSASRKVLVKEAVRLLRRASCDLVVANSALSGRYQAYLVTQKHVQGRFNSRQELAGALMERLEDEFERE